jgi:hypothetical protein
MTISLSASPSTQKYRTDLRENHYGRSEKTFVELFLFCQKESKREREKKWRQWDREKKTSEVMNIDGQKWNEEYFI